MRFKCGLSDAEKYAKEKAKELYTREGWARLVNEGQTKFALLPVHLSDGTCIWLENYRRFPVRWRISRTWYPAIANMSLWDIDSALRYTIDWRYEALSLG